MISPPPEKPYGAWAFLWAGVAAIVTGLLIATSHVYGWLRHGHSPDYPFQALLMDVGIGSPTVAWVGVQRIIDWIMASSAVGVLFFSGLILVWIGNVYVEDYDRQMRDHRQREFQREQDERRASRSKNGAAAFEAGEE